MATVHGAIAVQFGSDGSLGWQTKPEWRGSTFQWLNAAAVDRLDRVIAVGIAEIKRGPGHFATEVSEISVFRLTTNGQLDATFSNDGGVITPFDRSLVSPDHGAANAVAIDSNDRVVVAGTSDGKIAIVRYNPDGTLDRTFSADGKLRTDFKSATREFAFGVAIDVDGRIYVAGLAERDGGVFMLARYTPNGKLDASFNDNGKVVTNFRSSAREGAQAIALTAGGQPVLAGFAFPESGGRMAVARYNLDGSLDQSFSLDGKRLPDFVSTTQENANGVAIDHRGRIVLAGTADKRIALARLNPDGSYDRSFGGGDGKVLRHIAPHLPEIVTAMAIDNRRRIVVAGTFANGRLMVARFKTDGSPDSTFGQNGSSVFNPGVHTIVTGLAVRGDDSVALVGHTVDTIT